MLSNMRKNNILLSIGMIVKNEEKVLRRCLESLKPLMSEISCELIIADTGSSDSTVAIAKEYTNTVFYFEWINDFSAARNSTLDKAKGIWYMFIDADEYLDEDISEMVYFFKNKPLYENYKTVEITVRNYVDRSKKVYADSNLPRFHKINGLDDNVRFEDSIHETIPVRMPSARFSTILHHTGYVYESEQQCIDKKNRNLVLMRKEYSKHPEDIRLLSHLIDATTFFPDEKKKYIAKAINIVKKHRDELYGNIIFMQAIVYYKKENSAYALSLCNEYYKGNKEKQKSVTDVSIAFLKAQILTDLENYEASYNEYSSYFNLYGEYLKDKLDITDMSAHAVYGITETEFNKSIFSAALCLSELKRYNDAYELLSGVDIKKIEEELFVGYVSVINKLCLDSGKYLKLVECYGEVLKLNDETKENLVLYTLESVYFSFELIEQRMEYAKSVVSSGISGKYIDLMNVVIHENEKDISLKIIDFLKEIDVIKEGYYEIVYLSIKNKIDISKYVLKMDSSKFEEKIDMLGEYHDDFSQIVYNYGVPSSYMKSIKQFYWLLCVYEKASYRSFNLDEEMKYGLYMCFTSLLVDYVQNIYNPELLNDEDVEVIPALHRFGYFMNKANISLENGDSIGYIKSLKRALINCESMREIIELMLDKFKKIYKY